MQNSSYHFYVNNKLRKFIKTSLLINFIFYLRILVFYVLCIVSYSTIKFMQYKFMRPALDLHK